MKHPAKTLMGESVVFTKNGKPHAAIVTHTHVDDPHKACLVYYCPVSHSWQEEVGATFGKGEGQYQNVECCD